MPKGDWQQPSRPELSDPDWLHARYVGEGLYSHEIAALLGISKPTVLKWLRYHQIPMRKGRHRRLVGAETAILTEYQGGDSLLTVAERHGTSAATVVRVLERNGIARRPPQQTHRRRQSHAWPTLMQDGWLEREYVHERKSMSIIAGQLGCGWRTVSKAMRAKGIPARHSPPTARPTAARSLSHRHSLQIKERFVGCALCACQDDLQVHHRDGDRANDTPENLIVLCKDCHAIAEWFIRPVEMRLRGRPELMLAA